jgi:hypothetical protein
MNTRFAVARVLVLALSTLALCAASWCATSAATLWRPQTFTAQSTHSVYAYRQWQSTGLYLETGDQVRLTASGQWSYSPVVGLHGPEGALPAPDYYPLPRVRGGALLARLGEAGNVFYVGPGLTFQAHDSGFLYLRINDDLLGDNMGKLTLKIEVEPAPPTPANN